MLILNKFMKNEKTSGVFRSPAQEAAFSAQIIRVLLRAGALETMMYRDTGTMKANLASIIPVLFRTKSLCPFGSAEEFFLRRVAPFVVHLNRIITDKGQWSLCK